MVVCHAVFDNHRFTEFFIHRFDPFSFRFRIQWYIEPVDVQVRVRVLVIGDGSVLQRIKAPGAPTVEHHLVLLVDSSVTTAVHTDGHFRQVLGYGLSDGIFQRSAATRIGEHPQCVRIHRSNVHPRFGEGSADNAVNTVSRDGNLIPVSGEVSAAVQTAGGYFSGHPRFR